MIRISSLAPALLLGLFTAASSQNLITNPGFESGGTGWTLFTQSGTVAAASVTYPSTGAHGGTRYARIAVTSPAASSAENWHIQFQPPTGWSASIGTTYEFKFWAKVDTAANIHVSVQGSDYTYISGTTFGLTPDWTEYTATYTADASGTNAVRFHVYVAETKGIYSFDDFTLTGTAPAGIRAGTKGAQGLTIRQGRNNLVLSSEGVVDEKWSAQLFDLRGTLVATATGKVGRSLALPLPDKNGTYLLRASNSTQSWTRKISTLGN